MKKGFRHHLTKPGGHSLVVKLTLLVLLFQPLSSGTASGDILISHSVRLDNIHPITFSSYPAKIITDLTTESLIKQKCTGGAFEEGAAPLNTTGVGRQNYDRKNSSFSFTRKEESIATLEDIEFTINEINNFIPNHYSSYNLQYRNSRLGTSIVINRPRKEGFKRAGKALTFPIVRTANGLPKTISPTADNVVANHQQLTTGYYRLTQSGQNELVLRNDSTASQGTNAVRIIYRDTKELLFTEYLKGKDHVLLDSVKGMLANFSSNTRADGGVAFREEETEDLNNVVFFGFNYKSRDEIKQALFQLVAFRRAFAKAIAKAEIVSDKFSSTPDAIGRPYNFTFDEYLRDDTVGSSQGNRAHGYIDYHYVQEGDLALLKSFADQNLRINLLYRAENQVFGPDDFTNSIIDSLRKTFDTYNIRFTATGKSDTDFDSDKGSGSFDIIFDTLLWGGNYLRYIEFLNPRNTEMNYLGFDVDSFRADSPLFRNNKESHKEYFSQNNMDLYKKHPVEVETYLWAVNYYVPVVIPGMPLRVNVLREPPALDIPTECPPDTGAPMPFYGVETWRTSAR